MWYAREREEMRTILVGKREEKRPR
jgi:hypothetical protein